MDVALGLTLALLSAAALSGGFFLQHQAAGRLPPLSLRRPLRSLRSLFAHPRWLVGFLLGLGGWALYVAALAVAPLSLVQACSAGGIGLLAVLSRSHAPRERVGVALSVLGLFLLGLSLAGGANAGHASSLAAPIVWLACSGAAAALAVRGSASLAPGAGLGAAAGILYAAGDVGTKAVLHGGAFLWLVPAVLAAHGLAFASLQLGFQRGAPLATAGVATLLTNSLPIVAGLAIFGEALPAGALGAVRLVAFALVVAGASALGTQGTPAAAEALG